jgi:endonuclease/exonuclease/phosphatase family metal-dependent hydrolase
MSMPRTWFSAKSLLALGLPAVVVTIGLQTMRLFFSSLSWYLRDTVGVGSPQLGAIAFATMATAFLAAVVRRLLGPRRALWLTAGGAAALRVIEQLTIDPAADLAFALAGTGLFAMFLPVWWGHVRALGGPAAARRLAGGLALGLALDNGLRSLGGTLDLSWITGPAAIAAVAGLAAACAWLLAREPIPAREAMSEAAWADVVPAFGLGPFLLLQMMVFQTPGWIAEVAGLPTGFGSIWVALGNLALAAGVIIAFLRPMTFRPEVAALFGLYLVLGSASAEWLGQPLLLSSLVAQFLFGWAWALLSVATTMARTSGLARTTVVLGASLIVFLLLAFLYYVSLDLALPLPRTAVIPAAAVLFAFALTAGGFRLARSTAHASMDRTLVVPATILLLAPLAWLAIPGPSAAPPADVRVMSYNIHSAFRVEGQQDPEAIARAIEQSGVGVVGLQEVSRGWLIDGSTDLVDWLARRLGMQAVFRGTSDAIWGNAVLSSYPIQDQGFGWLPQLDTLIRRGYIWVRLDVGQAEPLTLIVTHLHQIEGDSDVRLEQVPVLLEAWGGAPRTVILGDLNAEPGSAEMELLAQAGLVDAWSVAGSGPGFTWRADAPDQRIDWIWVTPDLIVKEFTITETTASDHLPVWVVLDPAP